MTPAENGLKRVFNGPPPIIERNDESHFFGRSLISIAATPNSYDPGLNPTYQDFACHYGTTIDHRYSWGLDKVLFRRLPRQFEELTIVWGDGRYAERYQTRPTVITS
ncbi:MAG: hypothetical protein PHR30_05610 [Gallionellaceae bacterium]|nr:hypothetical protein [Gallionellaceae bacterium]